MSNNENSVSDQENDFIFTIEGLTTRESACLRLVCNQDLNLDIPEMSNNRFKEIILKGKYKEGVINCLEHIVRKHWVPDEYFDWLKDSLRAQLFTLVYMRQIAIETIESINEDRKNNGESYFHPPSYRTIKIDHNGYIIEQIYELFDNYQIGDNYVDKHKKINYIENIRFLWSGICDHDSYIDLLEESNEGQIKWAKKYLKDKNLYLDNIYGAFSDEQKKAVILASIDLIEFKSGILKKSEYQESLDKNQFMNRMKKSWAQKKLRDSGEAKTLHHFALTKNTKKRLDEMVEDNDEKQVDLLSRLINKEYETYHLDKNGQKIYR